MASDELADAPILHTARVVTRYCLPEGKSELPHVTQLLSAYLGTFSAYWSILTAYKRTKSLRCVQFVAARESAKTQDPFYKRWLLNRTAELAPRDGDLPTIRWLMESYLPAEYLDNVVGESAASGHLEILQWLYDQHRDRVCFGGLEMCGAMKNKLERVVAWLREYAVPRAECRNDVLRAGVETGDLDVVEWLREDFGSDGTTLVKIAIKCCQWETARWIIEHCGTRIPLDMYFPARHGKLSFLKYLAARELGSFHAGTLVAAAAHGHLDVVKWLHFDQGVNLTVDAMGEAAQNGHLDMVQWLFETKSGLCDSSVLASAAEYGRLAVLEWIYPRWSGTLGTAAMDWAAREGHLEVVKWLHTTRKGGCSERAMDEAAVNGHLDVVQWLHEHRSEGCSKLAMDGAAGAGHLEVVKWLHNHRTEGCSTIAMNQAACNGHLDVVKWLHHNRSEGCSTLAMNLAARNGHFSIVKWIHENRPEGCTTVAMEKAAKYGYLKIVKWLHVHRRMCCSTLAMDKAAASGHLDALKWMTENSSERCSSVAMTHAVIGGHFDVVLYLHLHGKQFLLPANTTLRLPIEMQQWLRENYADDLNGCHFQGPNHSDSFRRVRRPPPVEDTILDHYNFSW